MEIVDPRPANSVSKNGVAPLPNTVKDPSRLFVSGICRSFPFSNSYSSEFHARYHADMCSSTFCNRLRFGYLLVFLAPSPCSAVSAYQVTELRPMVRGLWTSSPITHYHRDRVSNTTTFHNCSITDLVVKIIDHMVEEYSPATYKNSPETRCA